MSTRFKPKYNIRKGDSVVVIAGNDKDLTKPREVLQVNVEKGKVLVDGVAIAKHHVKPSSDDTKGGFKEQESFISISNVMLWDIKAKAATKIKRDRINGKLVRISKKSGEVIK